MNGNIFSDRLKDRILEHEPLFKYCNYRIGGPADLFFDAKNIEELGKIVVEAHRLKIPFRVIGQGSNMLFRDEGYRGLIIRNLTKNVIIKENDLQNLDLIVDSGLLMSQFLRMIDEKFPLYRASVEEFQGLPGTVGGAVYGNAGCFGKEFSELITAIDALEISKKPMQKIFQKTSGKLKFRYRASTFKDLDEKKKNGQSNIVILKVFLQIPLKKTQQPREILKLRASKQPPGYSCGSFFKNPEGQKSAGQLIEEAGCKGLQVGGAKVSEKHGNFFLNTGKATAKDLINLSEIVQKQVYEKFGIKLEEEVRIV